MRLCASLQLHGRRPAPRRQVRPRPGAPLPQSRGRGRTHGLLPPFAPPHLSQRGAVPFRGGGGGERRSSSPPPRREPGSWERSWGEIKVVVGGAVPRPGGRQKGDARAGAWRGALSRRDKPDREATAGRALRVRGGRAAPSASGRPVGGRRCGRARAGGQRGAGPSRSDTVRAGSGGAESAAESDSGGRNCELLFGVLCELVSAAGTEAPAGLGRARGSAARSQPFRPSPPRGRKRRGQRDEPRRGACGADPARSEPPSPARKRQGVPPQPWIPGSLSRSSRRRRRSPRPRSRRPRSPRARCRELREAPRSRRARGPLRRGTRSSMCGATPRPTWRLSSTPWWTPRAPTCRTRCPCGSASCRTPSSSRPSPRLTPARWGGATRPGAAPRSPISLLPLSLPPSLRAAAAGLLPGEVCVCGGRGRGGNPPSARAGGAGPGARCLPPPPPPPLPAPPAPPRGRRPGPGSGRPSGSTSAPRPGREERRGEASERCGERRDWGIRSALRAGRWGLSWGCAELFYFFYFFSPPKQHGCGSSTISAPRCAVSAPSAELPRAPGWGQRRSAAVPRREGAAPLRCDCEVTSFAVELQNRFCYRPLSLCLCSRSKTRSVSQCPLREGPQHCCGRTSAPSQGFVPRLRGSAPRWTLARVNSFATYSKSSPAFTPWDWRENSRGGAELLLWFLPCFWAADFLIALWIRQ